MFTVSKTIPIQKQLVSEVGFEPTPPCGDQNLNDWEGDNTLSLAP